MGEVGIHLGDEIRRQLQRPAEEITMDQAVLGDRGELPFYRVCKRGDRRFRLEDVMKFLAQNR